MRLTHRIAALLTVAAFISIAAPAAASIDQLTVTMKPLNGSGESGTATLTQLSNGVKIVVDVKNAPAAAQPTHIHIGTCGNINKAPEYPLVSITNGTSTSIVSGITIDQLLKGHYAINVHKSTSDLETYVSCGDIRSNS